MDMCSFELIQLLANRSRDSVFLKDLHGRYISINQSGAERMGRDVKDILGKDDWALWDARAAAITHRNDWRVYSEQRTLQYTDAESNAGEGIIWSSVKG